MYKNIELNPMEKAAIKAAGNIPNWLPYYYDKVENGILIKGCLTSVFQRGPRKGERKYLIKEMNKTVIVTKEMQDAELPRGIR